MVLLFHEMPSANFKIKFNGSDNQIEANTLINSLIHSSTILQEANRFLDPSKKIDIKIKALETGSFIIDVQVYENVLETIKHLFTKENLEYGGTLVGLFTTAFKIRKFLKKSKPSSVTIEGENVKLENEEGSVTYVDNRTYNFYNNSERTQNAITQQFETLSQEPSITGFEVTDVNNKPYVHIEKEDFSSMAAPIEEVTEGAKVISEETMVNIVRISFDKTLKWDFNYKGFKISARVTDEAFYKRIDKGEAFAKGDTLKVNLQINQEWDPTMNSFINKSYQVLNIIDHYPSDKNETFPFVET